MEEIIKNIRHIIDEKGYKQKSVSVKAGIAPKTFSAILTGRRRLHHDELVRLCVVLDTDPNTIYGIHSNNKSA